MQVTGLVLLAGTVLLKWSFIAPYLTDRIAKWTLVSMFPFAYNDFLSATFFKSNPCNLHPKPLLIRAQRPEPLPLRPEL